MKRIPKNSVRLQTGFWNLALIAALCAAAQLASAATVVKDNNTVNLNLGTSWVSGAPPTSADIAQWDNTVTGTNTVLLGASTNWAGIKVIDPGGPVTLNNDANTLTLGNSGIDLTLATNSLTINCPLTLNSTANTYWSTTNGQSLTINSTIATVGNFYPIIGRYGTAGGSINLTGGSAGTPSVINDPDVRSLATMNISGYVNFASGGLTKFDISGGATINWTATGTVTSSYGWYVGDGQSSGQTTLNLTNGTMTVLSTSHNGIASSQPATVNVAGGNLVFGNTCNLYIGASYNNGASGNTGILNIFSGTVDVGTSTSGLFEIGKGATGSGTINLNGGTLSTMRSIMSGGTAANGTFNFNGGTLKAKGNQTALIAASVPTVNVRNSGAVIDDGGFAIGIGATLQHSTIGGDNPTDGGLTKKGTGTLTFPGGLNLTYNGPTAITAGELMVSTLGSCSNSAVTVSAGATNGVQKDVGGIQWSCAGLTYAPGNTYLDLNFLAAPGLSKAPLQVNGSLAINGTLNVIIRGTALWSVGTYPLIKYTGTLSGTVPTTPLVLPPGVVATIRNNTGNKSIDLSVSVGNGTNPQIVTWRPGSGTWDISTTANWNNSDGNPVVFVNGEQANFDDTATGPSPISVELDSTVNPAGATFNNTLINYTITGSGGISGTNSLTKSGTNSVTMNVANTYSGGTLLNGGILAITNDNGLGSAAAPLSIGSATLYSSANNIGTARPITLFNSSTLMVDPATTLSLTNGFTNIYAAVPFITYTVTLNGGGTLGLEGGNANIAYDKLFNVDNATLQLDNGIFNDGGKMALGTYAGSTVTMNVNNGTFNMFGTNGGAWFVMADNAAANATLNVSGGTMNVVTTNIQSLLLGNKGIATINVTAGSIHVNSDPNIYLGGHPAYAANNASGTLNISGTGLVTVDPSTTGTFALGWGQSGAAGCTGTINLQSGGKLATGRNIVGGNENSYFYFSGGTLTATTNIANFLQGLTQVAIDANGATIDDGGFAVSIVAALSDNGGGFLTKKGGGTLYLDGANNYTGPTVVTAGALGGSGTIAGDLTVNTGAALAPGDAGTNIGTLTVGGNLTLQGNVLVKVNTSLVQSNDVVAVTGGLTNNGAGTVKVTNVGPTLAVGDTFTLFSQPVTNGSALTVTGGGATWANRLAVDGSISVLTVIPQVAPSATGVSLLPDHNISLTCTGAVGTAWSLRATNNVAAHRPWPVLTNGTVTVSPFAVQDLTATNSTEKFYYFSAP
jgi:autotransporter-associated beta strand protein